MKIKKSLVLQIVKEEAIKVKKLIELNEEKKAVMKQLNELYQEVELDEEQPEESVIKEEESILGLIPNPQDQQVAQQDLQQTQQAQQGAAPAMLEEAMGGVMGKLQNLLFGKVKAQNPEAFEQAADAIGQKYANASYADIFNSIKAIAQPAMEEAAAGKKTMTKDEAKSTVEKIAAKVGSSAGAAAPLTYLAGTLWTAASGTAFGIPAILGMISGGLIIAAIVAGLIYLLASYYKQKKQGVK
jgi:hypothetical protein